MIPFLVKHFNNYADEMASRFDPSIDNHITVLEMGCNDGVFLRPLADRGFDVIGVDPSDTVTKLIEDGFNIYNTFMCDDVVDQIVLKHGQVDLFFSSNSFAHIDDMKTIFSCVKRVLKPKGRAFIEVHYLSAVVDELNFDFIYHEHMTYYSVSSFMRLATIFGMTLIDVTLTSVHGKSLRIELSNNDLDSALTSDNVDLMLQRESHLRSIDQLQLFSKSIYDWRDEFSKLYSELKRQGFKIYGYGASGRATTLCNFAGIDIPVIIDDAQSKIGSFTPRYHAPIVSSAILKDPLNRPDYVVILAWPYANNIIENNKEYQQSGGKFIIPLPKITTTTT
jgi:SAM-dependent methyltransferase